VDLPTQIGGKTRLVSGNSASPPRRPNAQERPSAPPRPVEHESMRRLRHQACRLAERRPAVSLAGRLLPPRDIPRRSRRASRRSAPPPPPREPPWGSCAKGLTCLSSAL